MSPATIRYRKTGYLFTFDEAGISIRPWLGKFFLIEWGEFELSCTTPFLEKHDDAWRRNPVVDEVLRKVGASGLDPRREIELRLVLKDHRSVRRRAPLAVKYFLRQHTVSRRRESAAEVENAELFFYIKMSRLSSSLDTFMNLLVSQTSYTLLSTGWPE